MKISKIVLAVVFALSFVITVCSVSWLKASMEPTWVNTCNIFTCRLKDICEFNEKTGEARCIPTETGTSQVAIQAIPAQELAPGESTVVCLKGVSGEICEHVVNDHEWWVLVPGSRASENYLSETELQSRLVKQSLTCEAKPVKRFLSHLQYKHTF